MPFTHEYIRNLGILLVTPILCHKNSCRPQTTHCGVLVGTVQELVNCSLDNLVDLVEKNLQEGNKGPDTLENLEGDHLEALENGENFKILENKQNL